MRATVVVVVILGALAGCPFQEPCNDDDEPTRLVVEGETCDGCEIDFGDVTIGLHDDRRVDILLSCEEFQALGAGLQDGSDTFTVSSSTLPSQPGADGFVRVDFAPDAAEQFESTLRVDFETGAFLEAHVVGAGVPP